MSSSLSPWHQQQQASSSCLLTGSNSFREACSLTPAPRCLSSTCPHATCQSRILIVLSSDALAREIE